MKSANKEEFEGFNISKKLTLQKKAQLKTVKIPE